MKAEDYIAMAFHPRMDDVLTAKTAPLVEAGLKEALDRLEKRQEVGRYFKPRNPKGEECKEAIWNVVSGLTRKSAALDAWKIADLAGVNTQTARGYLSRWVADGSILYTKAKSKRYLYYMPTGKP